MVELGRHIFGVLIFILATQSLQAQDLKITGHTLFNQTTRLDTAKLLSDQPLKSPWGAVGRSTILPGWGQIYTEHYLKAPLYFSINAFFAYQIYHYEMLWRDEKNEGYRSKRNQFTWYFALSYLLTMVDAYVDAYLYKFDDAMRIAHYMKIEEGVWTSRVEFSIQF